MNWPEFALSQLPRVLDWDHVSEGTALGFGRGDAGAISSESASIGDARVTDWARASGRCLDPDEFSQSLDGRQLERELITTFREDPEFGRSLARRLAQFHAVDTTGPLTLIGGGGEAVVFGDVARQRVVKLLGKDGPAGFGWEVDLTKPKWSLRPSTLVESLRRYWLAEQLFPSGLEIDYIGTDGSFLVLSQTFLLGENPEPEVLDQWMRLRGWSPFRAPSDLKMLRTQTWRKGSDYATDVRPENAILCESDGQIRPFDFIVTSQWDWSPSSESE